MKDKDIKTLLLAARNGPFNSVKDDLVAGWDYAKLSSVIEYCYEEGYVRAIEATHSTSPHREFILEGIAAEGENFLISRSISARIRGKSVFGAKFILGIVAFVSGFLAIVNAKQSVAIYHHLLNLCSKAKQHF